MYVLILAECTEKTENDNIYYYVELTTVDQNLKHSSQMCMYVLAQVNKDVD